MHTALKILCLVGLICAHTKLWSQDCNPFEPSYDASTQTGPWTKVYECNTSSININPDIPNGTIWYLQDPGHDTNTSRPHFTEIGGNGGWTISAPGTYQIRAFDQDNNCWSSSPNNLVDMTSGWKYKAFAGDLPTLTVSTNTCGMKTITAVGVIPKGITWYWHDNNQNSTSVSNPVDPDNPTRFVAEGTDTYYLGARGSDGCDQWVYASIPVTVNPVATTPSIPESTFNIDYYCGEAKVTRANTPTSPPSGESWYWQSSANKAAWNDNHPYYEEFSVDYHGSIYLTSATVTTGNEVICWSDYPQEFAISSTAWISPLPDFPSPETVESDNYCGPSKTIHVAETLPPGATYYWQGTDADGTSQSLPLSSNPDYTVTSTGTYYLGAFNQGCWAYKSVNVTINDFPDGPPGTITIDPHYGCGKVTVDVLNTPPNGTQWHWQSSETGEVFNGQSGFTIYDLQSYFLRAFDPLEGQLNEGCWSTGTVSFAADPNQWIDTPVLKPTMSVDQSGITCNQVPVAIGSFPEANVSWYWQGEVENGTSTGQPLTENTSVLVSSPGTYYIAGLRNDCGWVYEELEVEASHFDQSGAILTINGANSASRCQSSTDHLLTLDVTLTAGLAGDIYESVDGGPYSKVSEIATISSSGSVQISRHGEMSFYFKTVANGPCPAGLQSNTVELAMTGPLIVNEQLDYGDYCSGEPVTIELESDVPGVQWYQRTYFESGHIVDTREVVHYSGTPPDSYHKRVANTSTSTIKKSGVYISAKNGDCMGPETLFTWDIHPIAWPGQLQMPSSICDGQLLEIEVTGKAGSAWIDYKPSSSSNWIPLTEQTSYDINISEDHDFRTRGYIANDPTPLCPQTTTSTKTVVWKPNPSDNPPDIETTHFCDDMLAEKLTGSTGNLASWYWQDSADGTNLNHYSDVRFYEEGSTVFLRQNVEGCWGPQFAGTPVVTLPNPDAPQVSDGRRFGLGEVYFDIVSDRADQFNWYNEEVELFATSDNSHTYHLDVEEQLLHVEAIDPSGCVSHSKTSVLAKAVDFPKVRSVDGRTRLEIGTNIDLILISSNYGSIQWYHNGVELVNSNDIPRITLAEPGLYYAKVGLPNGSTAVSNAVHITRGANSPIATQPVTTTYTGPSSNPIAANVNYVRTFSARVPEQDENNLSLSATTDDVAVSTSYADGMAREIQQVTRGYSHDGSSDLVTVINYDGLGRADKSYLPYSAMNDASGLFKTDPVSDQHAFYATSNHSVSYALTDVPLGFNKYEESPLSRMIESSSPGERYYPGEQFSREDRKTQRQLHTSNSSYRDGRIYVFEMKNNSLLNRGYYEEGLLTVTMSQDPMRGEVWEFKNSSDKVVLKRVKQDAQTYADTYYVYDDYDNLVAVIPPEAVHRVVSTEKVVVTNQSAINQNTAIDHYDGRSFEFEPQVSVRLTDGFHANGYQGDYFSLKPGEHEPDAIDYSKVSIAREDETIYSYSGNSIMAEPGVAVRLSDGFHVDGSNGEDFFLRMADEDDYEYDLAEKIENYLFLYQYDERQRMVAKKVPGADWTYMAYDQWDRLVLSQTPVQAEKDEWLFTKYDAINRPVVTGLVVLPEWSTEEVRAECAAIAVHNTPAISTGVYFDLNASFPTATISDVLTASYYDDYSSPFFSDMGLTTGELSDNSYLPEDLIPMNKGQITGGYTRVLNSDVLLKSATYYDERYRPIVMLQDVYLDHVISGRDKVYNHYDFVGNMTSSRTEHTVGTKTINELHEYTYDHQNRLLTQHYQLGEDPLEKVVLAEYEYDELGNVKTKEIFKDENGVDPKPLQSIEHQYHVHGYLAGLNAQASDPDETLYPDVFAMKLAYDDGFEQINYDGQISGVRWYNVGDRSTPDVESALSYGYTYDGMKRILAADYAGQSDYTMSVEDYDMNGNILGLTRYGGKSGALIDQLEYEYVDNRLINVTDRSYDQLGMKDAASMLNEYAYDAAGNMVEDKNKYIERIAYNHLNLPDTVHFTDGRKVIHTYSADGAKLAVENIGISSATKTEYASNKVYEDGELAVILTDEGRVVDAEFEEHQNTQDLPEGWHAPDYQFFLKDHLGNTRAVLSSNVDEGYHISETLEDITGAEDPNAQALREQLFFNTHIRTLVDADLNHTSTQQGYACMLNTDGLGTAFMVPVRRGDSIRTLAYAKYTQSASQVVPLGVFSTVIDNLGAVSPFISEGVSGVPLSPAEAGGLALLAGDGMSGAPQAYLQYLYFDRNFKLREDDNGFGYVQVEQSAWAQSPGLPHQELVLDKTFDQDGFVLIYVTNATEGIDVYFDDLTVHHTMSPVKQITDYYPFGLEMVNEHNERQHFTRSVNTNERLLQADDLHGYFNFYTNGDGSHFIIEEELRIESSKDNNEYGFAEFAVLSESGKTYTLDFDFDQKRGTMDVEIDGTLINTYDEDGHYTLVYQGTGQQVTINFKTTTTAHDNKNVYFDLDNIWVYEVGGGMPPLLKEGFDAEHGFSLNAYKSQLRHLEWTDKLRYLKWDLASVEGVKKVLPSVEIGKQLKIIVDFELSNGEVDFKIDGSTVTSYQNLGEDRFEYEMDGDQQEHELEIFITTPKVNGSNSRVWIENVELYEVTETEVENYDPVLDVSDPFNRPTANRYLYNGKELQQETGWLDYGARMYMADLGRWGVIDLMADEYLMYSPYSFVGNDPNGNLEIDGNYWIKVRQNKHQKNKTTYGIGINDYRRFQRNSNYSNIPFLGAPAGMSNLLAKSINSITNQDPSLSWDKADTWSAASSVIGGGMGKLIRAFGSGGFAQAGASITETFSELTGITGNALSSPDFEELIVDLSLVQELNNEGIGYIDYQIDGTGHRTGFIDGFSFSEEFIDGIRSEVKSDNPKIKSGRENRLVNRRVRSYVEERRDKIKSNRDKDKEDE